MKETGQTAASEEGRAEEIVESKIESWIPISYAVRHKGRHSSLFPSALLPLVPPPAASRIHHVSCTPQPSRPTRSLPSVPSVFPSSAISGPHRGRTRRRRRRRRRRWFIFSVGGGGGDEGDFDWREDRRLTRLVPHFAPTSRVGVGCGSEEATDKHDNDDDMHAGRTVPCAGGRVPR